MHLLQQLCEDLGYDTRSYSGRSMYGKECLGIDLDSGLGSFIGDVIRGLSEVDSDTLLDHESAHDVAEAFDDMQTDDMGRGMIVYFPGTPFTDNECDDEDDHGI